MLRKRVGGDFGVFRPSASAHNKMVDAANQALKFNYHRPPDLETKFRQYGTIRVRNETGGTLGTRSVVGLSGPLSPPTGIPVFYNNEPETIEFLNRPAFSAVAPTIDHLDRFAVLQQPISNNMVGEALLSGVTQCIVRYDSGVFDRFSRRARVSVGTTGHLVADDMGPVKILWAENENDSSEFKRCLVQLDAYPVTGLYAATSGTFTLGGLIHPLEGPVLGFGTPLNYGGVFERVDATKVRILRYGTYRSSLSFTVTSINSGAPEELRAVAVYLLKDGEFDHPHIHVFEYSMAEANSGFDLATNHAGGKGTAQAIFRAEAGTELTVQVSRLLGSTSEHANVRLELELLA